jgi:hypothetical protein
MPETPVGRPRSEIFDLVSKRLTGVTLSAVLEIQVASERTPAVMT